MVLQRYPGNHVRLGEVGGALEMSSSRAATRGRYLKRRKGSRKMSIASTQEVGVEEFPGTGDVSWKIVR